MAGRNWKQWCRGAGNSGRHELALQLVQPVLLSLPFSCEGAAGLDVPAVVFDGGEVEML